MKTLALLLIAAAALHADPPRFAIITNTHDAGGGGAMNARFTLTGTIGQPDAAPRFFSANNRFAIEPGFWGGYSVVQQPGLPQLVIRRGKSAFVLLAWPIAAIDFTLEESPALSPATWTPVAAPVVDTATEHTVSVPMDAPKKFFRLRAP